MRQIAWQLESHYNIVNLILISIRTLWKIVLFECKLFENFLYWFWCYEFLGKQVASTENKQQAMGENDCMTEREPWRNAQQLPKCNNNWARVSGPIQLLSIFAKKNCLWMGKNDYKIFLGFVNIFLSENFSFFLLTIDFYPTQNFLVIFILWFSKRVCFMILAWIFR